MSIVHYDLFAGIGGFSLALDEVFHDRQIKHIFCEWEQFPTAVLKQHWPDGEYWGDIADLVAHTNSERLQRQQYKPETEGRYDELNRSRGNKKQQDFTIVTGGFPCQPFSAAGRRRGTTDDRYKWPEMFAVIRNVKPAWVIAENVRGLVTWNEGMVLEQVCSDLESEGYEVQPFIIPAVAVNAPHRRDRVWIIANAKHSRQRGTQRESYGTPESIPSFNRSQHGAARQPERTDSYGVSDGLKYPNWSRSWQEVAFTTCNDAMDDGLPRIVDGVPQSFAKWRQNSLKAYGNGIVMQVAVEIMMSIKVAEEAK